MKNFKLLLTISICVLSVIFPKQLLSAEGTICFPPAWGGIVTGFTVDQDLVTIHGEGLFSKWLGHGGGRYYVDSSKSMTMIAEIGVDHVIETVSIIDSIEKPKDIHTDVSIPVSSRINIKEGFGVWKRLHLGSTKEEVQKNIGKPTRIHKETWYYNTDYDNTKCYAAAEIGITFKKGVVYKVMFHNGC